MTTKADFTPEEWDAVLQAPPTAGMIVLTAQSGGTFKETWAISKAYVEARQQHGASELLDEIVSSKPEIDHTHYHSPAELRDKGLQHLRDTVALLGTKATPEDVTEFSRFILNLATKVAAAHREHGQDVSPAEHEAIQAIAQALGTPA